MCSGARITTFALLLYEGRIELQSLKAVGGRSAVVLASPLDIRRWNDLGQGRVHVAQHLFQHRRSFFVRCLFRCFNPSRGCRQLPGVVCAGLLISRFN